MYLFIVTTEIDVQNKYYIGQYLGLLGAHPKTKV